MAAGDKEVAAGDAEVTVGQNLRVGLGESCPDEHLRVVFRRQIGVGNTWSTPSS
ncbi:MAG: hypothetical protein ABI563_08205 [Specibacter sp.]